MSFSTEITDTKTEHYRLPWVTTQCQRLNKAGRTWKRENAVNIFRDLSSSMGTKGWLRMKAINRLHFKGQEHIRRNFKWIGYGAWLLFPPHRTPQASHGACQPANPIMGIASALRAGPACHGPRDHCISPHYSLGDQVQTPDPRAEQWPLMRLGT